MRKPRNSVINPDLTVKYAGVKIDDISIIDCWAVKKLRTIQYARFTCHCLKQGFTRLSNLLDRGTRSCGCIKNVSGGLSKTPIGSIYIAMMDRCDNPDNISYRYYGGKGVEVCDAWLDFKEFVGWCKVSGYAPGLRLSRVDKDSDYCPNNCYFAAADLVNRDRTSSKYSLSDGEKMSDIQASLALGKGRAYVCNVRSGKRRNLYPDRLLVI